MRLRHETLLWAETLTFKDRSSDMLPPDASVGWEWATEKKYGIFLHDATRCCTSWPHIKWIYNGNMPEMPEGNTSHSRTLSLFLFSSIEKWDWMSFFLKQPQDGWLESEIKVPCFIRHIRKKLLCNQISYAHMSSVTHTKITLKVIYCNRPLQWWYYGINIITVNNCIIFSDSIYYYFLLIHACQCYSSLVWLETFHTVCSG